MYISRDDTWSMNKETERKINSFEMRFYRKILRVQWTEKRTNISILQQLGNILETGCTTQLWDRKWTFFSHSKRHDNLEREIYEGIIEGRRGRGRPKRRTSQDITDRMNMNVTEAGRCAQDRDAYRRRYVPRSICQLDEEMTQVYEEPTF